MRVSNGLEMVTFDPQRSFPLTVNPGPWFEPGWGSQTGTDAGTVLMGTDTSHPRHRDTQNHLLHFCSFAPLGVAYIRLLYPQVPVTTTGA